MRVRRILVINPNSNASVTAGLEAALAWWRRHPAIDVECTTLTDGPFGIESDEDIRNVSPLVIREVSSRRDCDAFVIACYSDPGLAECRAQETRPVFGMQQSAVATAIARGGRFGVLAMSQRSIERHLAYLDSLGVLHHLAAELPLDISVDAAANDAATFDKACDVGRRLIAESGANVLVLGCAGMSTHRRGLESALGVPVIDPVQAAVALAAGAVSEED